ncbi:hypothetical protein vBEcoMWL3_gp067 [Escherichia phage vB_EcoM_WL-3]|nr:hypothetical protein vBEcoMWL3_gp067 [Escherichia phage vB_EcoM_WL-3]
MISLSYPSEMRVSLKCLMFFCLESLMKMTG